MKKKSKPDPPEPPKPPPPPKPPTGDDGKVSDELMEEFRRNHGLL